MKKTYDETEVGRKLTRLINSDASGQVDFGDEVICDVCETVWTGRPESGGFVYDDTTVVTMEGERPLVVEGQYAACPDCAPRLLEAFKQNSQLHLIREYCPNDLSYYLWVMQLRGGNNVVKQTIVKP